MTITITLATAFITFIVVSLWSKYSYTKGNKNLYVSFEALNNELNQLAQELGHKDIYDYWSEKKGQDYAERGKQNIDNALKFLREA
jgi:hypothetical protein